MIALRSPAHIGLLCALVVVAAGQWGCIGMLSSEGPAPATLGSHHVGVTTMVVQDASRDRSIEVEVWYPAVRDPEDDEPEIYSVRALGGTVARLRSRSGAVRDADGDRTMGPRPVVLLSHGSGSTRFASMTLGEILASHGYVVAAPDHAGHTVDDQVLGIDNDERALATLNRPLDLSRVLDALDRESRSSWSILRGLSDVDRTCAAGHSFGGTTALGMIGARFDAPRQAHECEQNPDDRRCRVVPVLGPEPYRYRDPRVRAAVLIAPGGFDLYRADGVAAADAPTLVVAGMKDEDNPFTEYAGPTYDALHGDRYLLTLRDAGHLTATDLCDIVDSIGFLAKASGGKAAVDGCGGAARGYVSTRSANDAVARAMLAFLDVHLNANDAARPELAAALAPALERVGPPERIGNLSAP